MSKKKARFGTTFQKKDIMFYFCFVLIQRIETGGKFSKMNSICAQLLWTVKPPKIIVKFFHNEFYIRSIIMNRKAPKIIVRHNTWFDIRFSKESVWSVYCTFIVFIVFETTKSNMFRLVENNIIRLIIKIQTRNVSKN